MSIAINKEKCIGCNKCIDICPGGLIFKNENNKAFIKYPKDCWGCTACLKECPVSAIDYFLGLDIGGRGAIMNTKKKGDFIYWTIKKTDGEEFVFKTNGKESNKY